MLKKIITFIGVMLAILVIINGVYLCATITKSSGVLHIFMGICLCIIMMFNYYDKEE